MIKIKDGDYVKYDPSVQSDPSVKSKYSIGYCNTYLNPDDIYLAKGFDPLTESICINGLRFSAHEFVPYTIKDHDELLELRKIKPVYEFKAGDKVILDQTIKNLPNKRDNTWSSLQYPENSYLMRLKKDKEYTIHSFWGNKAGIRFEEDIDRYSYDTRYFKLVKEYIPRIKVIGKSLNICGSYQDIKFSFKSKSNYDKHCYVNPYPSTNCQTVIFAPFQNLITSELTKSELLDIMKDAIKETGKSNTLVMFDIKAYFEKDLLKYFPKPKSMSPYKSTNSSDMILGMVNINDLIEKEKHEKKTKSKAELEVEPEMQF